MLSDSSVSSYFIYFMSRRVWRDTLHREQAVLFPGHNDLSGRLTQRFL